MIRLKVMGPNFAPITTMLDRLARPDLMPLAEDVRGIMIGDMRDMLLDGVNADGSPTAELKESTIRRGRSGPGPARAPRPDSPTVAGYDVDIEPSTDRILLIGGRGWPPYMHILARGRSNMAARDMLGVTPTGQGRIATATAAFARALIGGQP